MKPANALKQAESEDDPWKRFLNNLASSIIEERDCMLLNYMSIFDSIPGAPGKDDAKELLEDVIRQFGRK